MTVLHAVAVGRAVAKRTVQLPHRWLIASRPSLQLVATTIDFCPTMISFFLPHVEYALFLTVKISPLRAYQHEKGPCASQFC